MFNVLILINFDPLISLHYHYIFRYSQHPHPTQAGWLDSLPEEEMEETCKAWQDPMGALQAHVMHIRFNGNVAASTVPKK